MNRFALVSWSAFAACMLAPLARSQASLPVGPIAWIPFAGVAVLAVMSVAALVYMLGGIISSPNAKNWSRIQIYEALLSMFMLLLFSAFSYLFFINPQGAYRSLNLVPGDAALHTGCTDSNNIFSLAVCDLNLFNSAAETFGGMMIFIPFITGLVPGINIILAPILGSGISLFLSLSLLPPSIASTFSNGFKALLTLLILNHIQLLLLSGALLFLSLFVTIGLVARTLGFSKSFGGAMIALGLGLGLVYPLLVSITYGFVDYSADLTCFTSLGCTYLGGGLDYVGIFESLLATIMIFLGLPSPWTGNFAQLIRWFGYLVAGFTFIPFLNFLIVDAFIIELSSALGEKLDFMSLLTGII